MTAIYFTSMAFLPLLSKGSAAIPDYSSSIVNVSSISGCMKGSSAGQFAYAASKAAATHVGRMLATTFVKCGVRVNTIAPGVFPSEVGLILQRYTQNGQLTSVLSQMTTGKSDDKNKSTLTTSASNPSGQSLAVTFVSSTDFLTFWF